MKQMEILYAFAEATAARGQLASPPEGPRDCPEPTAPPPVQTVTSGCGRSRRQPKPGTSRPPRLRPVTTGYGNSHGYRPAFGRSMSRTAAATVGIAGRGHGDPLVPGHGPGGGPGAKAPGLHLKSPPGWVRPVAKLRPGRVGAGLWPDRPGRLAVKEGARRLKPQATSEKPSGLGQAFRKVAPCSGRGGSLARPVKIVNASTSLGVGHPASTRTASRRPRPRSTTASPNRPHLWTGAASFLSV